MYFNDEKSNTNIDRELSGSSLLRFLREKTKLIILIFIFIIIFLILFFIIRNAIKSKFTFDLLGNYNMKIYQNSEFIDPGFIAFDKNGNDISNKVKIKGTVNTNVSGNYTITYSLRNKKIQRIVTVIDKAENQVGIFLKGNLKIYLSKGEEYIEPGYVCLDSIDGDLTSSVQVSNNIDINTPGMYKVIYTVINSSNVTTTVSRVVIVE